MSFFLNCIFFVPPIDNCKHKALPPAPDLSVGYILPFNTIFTNGQSRDIIIKITEVNGLPTTGAIQVQIEPLPEFTFTFNPVQVFASTLLPPFITTVNNPDWVSTPFGGGLLMSSNIVIPANGFSQFAINLTATGFINGENLNVVILPGSGGDTNSSNNSRLIVITTN